MANALLLFFLLLFYITQQARVVVKSSYDLEQYLCNTTSSKFDDFLLDSSNYNLSSGQFCQVSHQANAITISSNSTNGSVITCTYNKTTDQQRGGLVFFNSIVTLQQVTFQHCGTFLNTISDSTVTNYFNSSSFYYSPYHAAVLVFVHCQVNLTNVNIYYSFGFAMIGVNLLSSSINEVNVSFGFSPAYLNRSISVGSGIIIHYLDTLYIDSHSTNVSLSAAINRVIFSSNIDINPSLNDNHCIIDLVHREPLMVLNAAGLTILYDTRLQASVSINEVYIKNNTNFGGSPGGLLIMQYKSSLHTTTIINSSVFENNINYKCSGAAFSYWYQDIQSSPEANICPLRVHNSTFKYHRGNIFNATGTVFLGIINLVKTSINVQIEMKSCSFNRNLMSTTGAALHAIMYKNHGISSILLENITASENSQYTKMLSVSGIFSFYGIHHVHIAGISEFRNNYGSVIDSFDSNINITGKVTFADNSGVVGSAIHLSGRSNLFFTSTETQFVNNHAIESGGAIFINLMSQFHYKCPLMVHSSIIEFSDNSANWSGNSIYMNELHACEIEKYYLNNFLFLKNISNHRLQVSFQATKLVSCDDSGRHENVLQHSSIYPGQTLSYRLSAVDLSDRSVYSTVYVDITSRNKTYNLHLSPHQLDTYLNYRLEETKCTQIY